MNRKKSNEKLSSAEMGKLWATYVGNTMGQCVLSYYLNHVDNQDIKNILIQAKRLAYDFNEDIKLIFQNANFPLPVGFTEDDVDVNAPRLFYDDFYLYYLHYLGKAGMSIYNAAISLVSRDDIVQFFNKTLNDTINLMINVHNIMKSKGIVVSAPPMPAPDGVDFVNRQSFLHGYIGEVRPLHGLEVAHLYGNLSNDITSKALIIGFQQTAQHAKVKKYLERGEKINHKHITLISNKLINDHLPAPSIIDHLVTSSTTPVFSDKLMTFHKIDMFSMKIREYANGASLNGRKDVGAMYAKLLLDVSLYVEDGANIMIDHGWMEQPPLVIDRSE